MEVENKIKEVITKITGLKKGDIVLEIPKPEFGDYSFACFILARKEKKNPNTIAKEMAAKIKAKLPKEIEKVGAVGGYVNFFVNNAYLAKLTVDKILEEKEKYGSLDLKQKENALIEHTSINPNSSPHVGRIRNALIGDVLARLLKFHGYKTEVHYYVNDISKQMALLVLGSEGNETFDDLLNLYVAMSEKMEQEPETEKQVFEILRKIEDNDKETKAKLNKLVKTAIEGQIEILSMLGINYDFFDYESAYLEKGKLKDILNKLEKTKRMKKDVEGRYILDQSNLSWQFEKEMKSPILVLTRSDDTGLYILRDIAYTIDKMKKAKTNIIVLGEDQKLYFKQLCASLQLIGYDYPKIVHYSFVLLNTKQGAKKMSTRKGEVILVSDFIKEAIEKAEKEIKKRKRQGKVDMKKVAKAVAIGAIRYGMTKVEENKSIIFDWQEALNFEGNSAPYLQYVHARASSILNKLGKEKLQEPKYEKIDEKEFALVKDLANFPKISHAALEQLKPYLLCNYAYSLAQKFNDFYESCPVIKADKGIKERRVILVQATKQVLFNVLNLIGVPVLEVM